MTTNIESISLNHQHHKVMHLQNGTNKLKFPIKSKLLHFLTQIFLFLFFCRFCIDQVNYDRFSDPDSLSFNSLSRSSSLIQFESLERQMQTGDTFGGSSPFLNNAVVTNQSEATNKSEFGANATAKPLINELPIDVNSSRNYYDIEKIDFNSALFLNCQEQTSSSESSYSTDNSIYYSDTHADVEPSSAAALSLNQAKEKMQLKTLHSAKMAFRSKNSTENLSEDSGYGEFPSIKCRSKSIPNLNQDQLIEEDEHLDYNHRSLNNISQRKTQTTATPTTSNRSNGEVLSSKINSTHAESVRSRKAAAAPTNSAVFGASKNSCRRERDWSDSTATPTNANGVSSKRSTSSTSLLPNTIQSTSLPDISTHFADDYGN